MDLPISEQKTTSRRIARIASFLEILLYDALFFLALIALAVLIIWGMLFIMEDIGRYQKYYTHHKQNSSQYEVVRKPHHSRQCYCPLDLCQIIFNCRTNQSQQQQQEQQQQLPSKEQSTSR